MRLVKPSVRYKRSFLNALREVQQIPKNESHKYAKYNYAHTRDNFAAFVAEHQNRTRGVGLPLGYVPETTWWLVQGNQYRGRVTIRHKLTHRLKKAGGHIGYEIRPSQRGKGYGKTMLRLALSKARSLGLQKVLLTCDKGNHASQKIILANGGVKEKSRRSLLGAAQKYRYWIMPA